jgi:hypothetical protein
MHAILIDWLTEVHTTSRLSLETLYLSTWFLDPYLSCRSCARTRLQLAGRAALLLASKYE